jgi:zinc protease
MDQYRTNLAQRNENPEAVFSDEITRIAFGGSPWFKPLELQDLAKADTDKALNFVKRGMNPADYTFIFTGNIDIDRIRGYIETYLASIPRTDTWNTWTDPGVKRPGKSEQVIYKGKEEKSLVFQGWFLPEAFSEQVSAATAVLSEYLDIRMTEEIREKLGGVYSVDVGVYLSNMPPKGELVMQTYFICDPRRAAELSKAILGEIERVAAGTIETGTFTKAVEAQKKSFEDSMQNNMYIARSYANYSVIFNVPLNHLEKRPEFLSSVSPDDLRNIALRLLPGGPLQMILYPEGWRE